MRRHPPINSTCSVRWPCPEYHRVFVVYVLTLVPAIDALFLLPSHRSPKMADPAMLVPAHLLADFDAAVLHIFETVDDGSLQCV